MTSTDASKDGLSVQRSTPRLTSETMVAVILFVLDVCGIVLIFALSNWLITGDLDPAMLLSWKLILIVSITFLFYYLMDLYTFQTPFLHLGILERSVIAMIMIAIATALAVYIVGPSFIGGFVGRGVLVTSLAVFWLWTLVNRIALNARLRNNRGRIKWLVLINRENLDDFIAHFRSLYASETLYLLVSDADEPRRIDDQTRILGNWSLLEDTVTRDEFAGIIVMSAVDLDNQLMDQLMAIRIQGLRIYDINDFYEKFLSRVPLFNLNRDWIALSHGFDLIHNPIGLGFKRYLDISIAVLLGVLLAPLMLAVALLVLFTSGLPIIYSQIRTGENGRDFTVHKFRTMVRDAEPDGAQYAEVDDPRVTALGRILRKFRIDELPQLWNVLIGEMSFVGPRPERPEFNDRLQQQIPYYSLRHLVKPGITGWAQVMYGYGDSRDHTVEKLQYDLFYIKNYSVILDIAIIVRSLKVVLFGTGR